MEHPTRPKCDPKEIRRNAQVHTRKEKRHVHQGKSAGSLADPLSGHIRHSEADSVRSNIEKVYKKFKPCPGTDEAVPAKQKRYKREEEAASDNTKDSRGVHRVPKEIEKERNGDVPSICVWPWQLARLRANIGSRSKNTLLEEFTLFNLGDPNRLVLSMEYGEHQVVPWSADILGDDDNNAGFAESICKHVLAIVVELHRQGAHKNDWISVQLWQLVNGLKRIAEQYTPERTISFPFQAADQGGQSQHATPALSMYDDLGTGAPITSTNLCLGEPATCRPSDIMLFPVVGEPDPALMDFGSLSRSLGDQCGETSADKGVGFEVADSRVGDIAEFWTTGQDAIATNHMSPLTEVNQSSPVASLAAGSPISPGSVDDSESTKDHKASRARTVEALTSDGPLELLNQTKKSKLNDYLADSSPKPRRRLKVQECASNPNTVARSSNPAPASAGGISQLLIQKISEKDGRNALFLEKAFFAIASPQALVELAAACQSARHDEAHRYTETLNDSKMLMRALDSLDSATTRRTILKRFFLVRLMGERLRREETYRHQSTGPPQIGADTQSRADSNAFHDLLFMFYPHLKNEAKDSKEYIGKYTKLKNRLSWARNWYLLQDRFSLGILALVPCSDELRIGADRFQKLSSGVVFVFLDVLDEHRGSFIREVAAAISPSVEAVLCGNDVSPNYRFEHVDQIELLREPMDSDRLVSLCQQIEINMETPESPSNDLI
ncbi:hypothetical protein LOZ57_006786 [Ophidiomyces ophidiicola]|uniref:uncharacterized protein n=1 Tax=Ophidiomyces ophidiicola TaxID=1387563 RepID=UPI0020C21B3B|nr:uncharacterized protein LOZ57_006786 [Ophidiomyces ophidiicola]KAI1936142.1 hypothetical protein LOZ57_006786 [Ophidiomyces ophidiicola]KAI2047731.1 hypothetical protein LOZ43_005587 [Ophidiomyces ophidiicola]KAI2083709.1 hypothetical protein LOZ36_005492 [Ophidiomyces ophidiicola]